MLTPPVSVRLRRALARSAGPISRGTVRSIGEAVKKGLTLHGEPPGGGLDDLVTLWSDSPVIFVICIGMFLVGLALYLAEKNKPADKARYGCLAWALMCLSGIPLLLIVLVPAAGLFIVAWAIEGSRQLLGGFGVFLAIIAMILVGLAVLGRRKG